MTDFMFKVVLVPYEIYIQAKVFSAYTPLTTIGRIPAKYPHRFPSRE